MSIGDADDGGVQTVTIDHHVGAIVVDTETPRTVQVITRNRRGQRKTYSLDITRKRLLQLS